MPNIRIGMVRIKNYEGYILSCEDSRQYVEFEMKRRFDAFSDFLKCEEIKFSDYWGDFCLLGTEEDYRKWISLMAERTLKK